MSLANSRDERTDGSTGVVQYRQWPSARDGLIDVNGTLRPMSAAELQAWDAADAETRTAANARTIDAAITDALAELKAIVDAPAVGEVPSGTMTTAQLSNALRSMREAVQQNRNGAKRIAATLRQTIRLVRGDFDGDT